MLIDMNGTFYNVQESFVSGIHINRGLLKLALTIITPFFDKYNKDEYNDILSKNKIKFVRLLKDLCSEYFPDKYEEHLGPNGKLTLLSLKRVIELAVFVRKEDIPI